MRILHLVARSYPRGAELVALELAEELDASGHENRVLALVPAEDGSRDPRLPPLVQRVDLRLGTRIACTWRLHRLLRTEAYDVLLAHGGWPAQIAAVASQRKEPLLVWQRILGFPVELWQGPRRRLWRAIARRMDAAVALTDADEAEMRRLGFRGPVWVIPNFRRPQRFLAVDRAAASTALRRELSVDADVDLIAFVGHLVAQKRPERALDVLIELRRRGRRAHLVIAGDGPLRRLLDDLVVEHELSDSVTFLGHRHDVELVFGGVDVTVLTSDVEGMPGVAIEAQMTGCPLVTFPVGGVGEVVEDGVTGAVLSRFDSVLMADHVARLLDDDGLRSQMGAAARTRAVRFTARQSAATYEHELLSTLRRSSGEDLRRRPFRRRRPRKRP